MADGDTLLAHMIPSLTPQVEVAATRALAFLLNKSNSALGALNGLVRDTIGLSPEPVINVRVEQPFTVDGQVGRLDLVGFDRFGKSRLIGEAKFWARLGEGQGGGYLNQLDSGGCSVLLFIVPDARIDLLWREVIEDVTKGNGAVELETIAAGDRVRCCRVVKTEKFAMMISWRNLLGKMQSNSLGDGELQAEIRQLQGLADKMDSEAFLPLHAEDFAPQLAKRMRDLRRIYDNVIDRWRAIEGIDAKVYGTSPRPQTGYGRFLGLAGATGWFGVYYDMWWRADTIDTPFWLELWQFNRVQLDSVLSELDLTIAEENYIPIHLKLGAGYEEVLEDVLAQLKRIAELLKETHWEPRSDT